MAFSHALDEVYNYLRDSQSLATVGVFRASGIQPAIERHLEAMAHFLGCAPEFRVDFPKIQSIDMRHYLSEKLKFSWLLLFLLLCQLCFGTTVVLFFRPERIVAAADRKLLIFGPEEKSLSKSTQKIYLVKGRFIIATLGISYLVNLNAKGGRLRSYSFSTLVHDVEKQLSSVSTVSAVADIVAQTTTKELDNAIRAKKVRKFVENMASSAPNSNDSAIRLVVAGFDKGIARAFEMNFRIDKKTNRVAADTIDRTPPSRNGGLLATGFTSAIEQIKVPASRPRKELDRIDPNAFKILSGSGPEYAEEDQVRAMRALLTIQSEDEPCGTGKGANVVTLPAFGTGTLLEYSEMETGPDPDCSDPSGFPRGHQQ